MKLQVVGIILLIALPVNNGFVHPTTPTFRPQQGLSTILTDTNNHLGRPVFCQEERKHGGRRNIQILSSSSTSQNDLSDETSMLGPAVAVGVATAGIGFLYGKVLTAVVHVLWKIIPRVVSDRFGSISPMAFLTSICGFGGLLMAILSSKFGGTFALGDFVSAFSAVPAQVLPSSSINVWPLLILSLVTSASGFSVGPEAPMVCVGALVGASMARKWFGQSANSEQAKRNQETLAYAGAAGALTAFMGIPIAGSIFALEMTRAGAGLTPAGDRALSPAILSSLAALVLLRVVLNPTAAIGGHFAYGAVGSLGGRAVISAAAATGVAGALIGTVFQKVVGAAKKVVWSPKANLKPWQQQIVVKTTIGLLVGLISTSYPQTLFWGEGSLQCAIDGQRTAFSATHHGLTSMLTNAAKVNPSVPFATAGAAAQVGIAKLAAIILACIGKFPGGIIFPLFFAAAPLAHAMSSVLGFSGALVPVTVMCLMASTQASVTRTPLASALILALTASATTELSVLLPACLLSSYLGVFVARLLSRKSYFPYSISD